jgi:hypothetical protein
MQAMEGATRSFIDPFSGEAYRIVSEAREAAADPPPREDTVGGHRPSDEAGAGASETLPVHHRS